MRFSQLAGTVHTANFYYRIIPETRSFGLNCESVYICGCMAGYLQIGSTYIPFLS